MLSCLYSQETQVVWPAFSSKRGKRGGEETKDFSPAEVGGGRGPKRARRRRDGKK